MRKTALLLLGSVLLGFAFLPRTPAVAVAAAAPSPPPTVLSVWSPNYHSQTINDTRLQAGQTITVDLNITGIPTLINTFDLKVVYDNSVLIFTSWDFTGTIFPSGILVKHDLLPIIPAVRLVGYGGPGGNGTLIHLTFTIFKTGVSPIGLYETTLVSTVFVNGQLITSVVPNTTRDGYFTNTLRPGPVADFTFSPTQVLRGQQVTYNASAAFDRDNATIRYVDTDNNGVWDPGETVVYDNNGDGKYEAGEPVINGTAPAIGTILKIDFKIMYIDSDNNNLWEPGEAVVYDGNGNRMYDTGEPVIAKAGPTFGTLLKADPKILFVNSTTSPTEAWTLGKAVVYDSDSDGLYTFGKFHNDTVIAGIAPANKTRVESDPKILFVNATTIPTETWIPGKGVVYDSDGNGRYDSWEPLIAGAMPVAGSSLKVGLSGPANGIRFYSWFFGTEDGFAAILTGPIEKHIFGGELEPKIGNFWVSFRAIDFEGDEALKIEQVLVTEPMAHDLRISSFNVNPLQVTPGQNVTVRILVEDVGTFPETFNVTLKLKDNLVNSWPNQILNARGAKTFEYVIKTAGLSPGVYAVTGQIIMPVQDPTPEDNQMTQLLQVSVQQASLLPFLLETSGAIVAASGAILILKKLRSRRVRPELT